MSSSNENSVFRYESIFSQRESSFGLNGSETKTMVCSYKKSEERKEKRTLTTCFRFKFIQRKLVKAKLYRNQTILYSRNQFRMNVWVETTDQSSVKENKEFKNCISFFFLFTFIIIVCMYVRLILKRIGI